MRYLKVRLIIEPGEQTDFFGPSLLFLSGKAFMGWRLSSLPSFLVLDWQRLGMSISFMPVWLGRSGVSYMSIFLLAAPT